MEIVDEIAPYANTGYPASWQDDNKKEYASIAMQALEKLDGGELVFTRGWDFIGHIVASFHYTEDFKDEDETYDWLVKHRSLLVEETSLTYKDVDLCIVCYQFDDAIALIDIDPTAALRCFSDAMFWAGEVYGDNNTHEFIFGLLAYIKEEDGRRARAKRTKNQRELRAPIFKLIEKQTHEIYGGYNHANATTGEGVTDIIIEQLKNENGTDKKSQWDAWICPPAKITRRTILEHVRKTIKEIDSV